ncbi:MAG: 5-formyltetrahydrofolate cyclo-ligase [Pseudomonadota bacterium]|nr:5-formyltetrahydrofolate cyclo-ligase [Pseudomonadota bacterium]
MPSPVSSSDARRALRRQLLQARRAVDESQRSQLQRVAQRLAYQDPWLRRAGRVAAYRALPSEAPTDRLLDALHQQGKQLYLPRVVGNRMHFIRYARGDRLQTHPLGMAQPHGPWLLSKRALDVVIVPLVGFDRRGYRMGMGGGFYDRCFARHLTARAWTRPRLIGLAFEAQAVDRLPVEPHDVPLDAIITERGMTRFPRSR